MIIAVCVSNKRYLEEIKSIIYRYCENKKIDALVECFLNGDELLNSEKRYNMLFIDCAFSPKGLLFAEKIRRGDKMCTIIFLNNVASFSGEAFKSCPSGYVTYPIRVWAFEKVLDECFIKNAMRYPLVIKSSGETFCINTEEIVFIEAENKHSRIYLEDEIISHKHTMSSIYAALPKYMFLKISRWNIVNAAFVERFNNCEVTLKSGAKLSISRSYLKEFKSNYNEFIRMNNPDVFSIHKMKKYG